MNAENVPDPAAEGRLAALSGAPATANPHPPGSAQHVTWQMSYDAALLSDEVEDGPGDVA